MHEFYCPMSRRLRAVGYILGAVLAATQASYAVEVFDDFSDMNDTANPVWTHLDGAAASTGQTWDASSGAYRLTAPSNSEHPILAGYGFVGAMTGPSFTDVRVSADFIDFPSTAPMGGFMAIAARLNGDNGPPTDERGISLNGYSYQYEGSAGPTDEGEMVLNIFHGGAFKDIGSHAVILDPANDYRLILEIVGNVIHGQTWLLDGNGEPLELVSEKIRDLDAQPVGLIDHDGNPGTDQVDFVPYESGFSGIYGVGHVFVRDADFTIDNFRAESLSLVGDFNSDGVVNSSDLTQWQSDFGTNANSDADGDGDSDGNDFLLWQQNVGTSLPAPGVGAVPEPAAVGLALVAFGGLWSAGRPRSLARR
jgi:hypothetical protein